MAMHPSAMPFPLCMYVPKKETERRQDRLPDARQYVQSAYAVRTCTETEPFKNE
jgi:hypothetical protein